MKQDPPHAVADAVGRVLFFGPAAMQRPAIGGGLESKTRPTSALPTGSTRIAAHSDDVPGSTLKSIAPEVM